MAATVFAVAVAVVVPAQASAWRWVANISPGQVVTIPGSAPLTAVGTGPLPGGVTWYYDRIVTDYGFRWEWDGSPRARYYRGGCRCIVNDSPWLIIRGFANY